MCACKQSDAFIAKYYPLSIGPLPSDLVYLKLDGVVYNL